jgi:hypothetical protein
VPSAFSFMIKFNNFQNWLKEKFNLNTGQSWDNIILFYCEDERTALDRFFELYEEFINSSKKVQGINNDYH